MTFEDIFQSSFPENVNAIPVFDMVLSFCNLFSGHVVPHQYPSFR